MYRCLCVICFIACLISPRAEAGLVITEIMHSPTSPLSANPTAEWVEIYNGGTTEVNLGEFELFGSVLDPSAPAPSGPSTSGPDLLGTLAETLKPGEFAIAFDGLNPEPIFTLPDGTEVYDQQGYANTTEFEAAWNNRAPGTLMIQLNDWIPLTSSINPGLTPEVSIRRVDTGELIDIVSDFDVSPWPDTAQNQSIHLTDVNLDNSLSTSWQASEVVSPVNAPSGASTTGESVFASPGFFPASASNVVPEPSSLTMFMILPCVGLSRRRLARTRKTNSPK
jgi:hypothetical protein